MRVSHPRSRRAALRLWDLFVRSWPTVALLAAMRSVWLLAIPAAVVSVGSHVPVAVPVAAGVLFDAFALVLQQRLRRGLRTSCMEASARDALGKQGGVPESQTDAAFWSAYLSEYAISSDVPAILAALTATTGILVLASVRMGPGLVVPVAAVLAVVAAIGFLAYRRLVPRLQAIVERRAVASSWLAAAERDAGEIGGTASEGPFVAKVVEATRAWCASEDGFERRQIGQRSGLLVLLGAGLAAVLSSRGIDWLNLALADQGVQVSVRAVADVMLLAMAVPVALGAARHTNTLLTAHGELCELHPPESVPRLAPIPWTRQPREIVIRDLSVRYAGHLALCIPSWEASVERPLGIVGPNGSGKSTLAMVLSGVLAPSEGGAVVGGVPSVRIDRDAVAFVPQEPVLIETLTIAQNVRLVAPEATDEEVVRMLRRLGLDKPLEQKAGDLSRGERRRIALARALLKEAQLLVLDEPDSWLDVAGREALFELLRDQAGKCAIVLVSHRDDLLPLVGSVVRLTQDHRVAADRE